MMKERERGRGGREIWNKSGFEFRCGVRLQKESLYFESTPKGKRDRESVKCVRVGLAAVNALASTGNYEFDTTPRVIGLLSPGPLGHVSSGLGRASRFGFSPVRAESGHLVTFPVSFILYFQLGQLLVYS